MRKLLLIGAVVAGTAVTSAPPASAEERTCRGTLGAITVDNLRVPQGAACTLNGTRVQGTIKVERDATLTANGVRVIGNVQGENAANVRVVGGSTIGGSVQVVQGKAARVANSAITNDILFDDNTRLVEVTRNRVGGNVQAFQNTGGVTVSRNTIDGNLQCKENQPAPTGGNNTVHGNKEDQCARL